MSAHVTDLLDERASLSLHNSTTAVGDLEFRTDARLWSYAVSLPVVTPETRDPTRQPLIVMELHVIEGSVGVGVLEETLQRFVSTEVDVAAGFGPRAIGFHSADALRIQFQRNHLIPSTNVTAPQATRIKTLTLCEPSDAPSSITARRPSMSGVSGRTLMTGWTI